MKYSYTYKSGLKIRIWVNELPMKTINGIFIVDKKYAAEQNQLQPDDKQIVLELSIPRNVSNYGMLGLKYQATHTYANISINVNHYEEDIYEEAMTIQPDIVHKGIQEEYVYGILNGIEKNKLLKSGLYDFNMGAHSEVGSSENIFEIMTTVLLKLLDENNFNKDFVENIVKQAMYS